MSEPGPRVAAWLDTVSDLLCGHLYDMPHQVILQQLYRTFRVTGVGHSSSDSTGRQEIVSYPERLLDPVVELDEWLNGRSHKHHPLIRWHAVTGDPKPTSMDRVPTALVTARDRRPILSSLKQYGLEHQVAISYRLARMPAHQTYILGRDGADFSDDDLVVAQYAQRAITALDRHVWLMQQLGGQRGAITDLGLTGRETSVLALLAAGHPNRVIARRLGCSTAHRRQAPRADFSQAWRARQAQRCASCASLRIRGREHQSRG